jgi:signal transduction histidine kinase
VRRRLVATIVGVVLAVLLVLVPPVVLLLHRAAENELQARLSSQASTISASIADRFIQGQRPTVEEVAQLVPAGDELVITASDGTEIFRYGPAVANPVVGTATGPVGISITLATDGSSLGERIRGPLLALGAFAAGSIVLAAVLAIVISGRLTRPLRDLATVADRLGAGDFSAPVPPRSGIAEVDGIGTALGTSARRLDELVTAERSFTGDATHQLRTGLTGVSLELELLAEHPDGVVRTGAGRAHDQVERLTETLDDLLSVARSGAGRQRVAVDLADLIGHHVDDWMPRVRRAGRTLTLRTAPGVGKATVLATPGCVGQIVDILTDNALTHGRGAITITVLDDGVSVGDEGTLERERAAELFRSAASPAAPHGRGLVLARRLARADGGTLELHSLSPVVMVVTYPVMT